MGSIDRICGGGSVTRIWSAPARAGRYGCCVPENTMRRDVVAAVPDTVTGKETELPSGAALTAPTVRPSGADSAAALTPESSLPVTTTVVGPVPIASAPGETVSIVGPFAMPTGLVRSGPTEFDGVAVFRTRTPTEAAKRVLMPVKSVATKTGAAVLASPVELRAIDVVPVALPLTLIVACVWPARMVIVAGDTVARAVFADWTDTV